jgi:hypothetical protein
MRYNVYVIELDQEFALSQKAKTANPMRDPGKPSVYVGYTSKTPRARFKQHMSGKPGKKGFKLCSRVVFKYGIKLMPELYQHLNPILTKDDAMEVEVLLARILRKCGYTVWQN